MNFEHSTHARSWLFDEQSLHQCREKAVRERMLECEVDGGLPKVRKFASGFRQRYVTVPISHADTDHAKSTSNDSYGRCVPLVSQSNLTSKEQAILVRFHAHQITMLIGPTAILPSLVRDRTVLATAITFFRRFYLSNSILNFKPRRMAVAAAFLASKVEDQRVEIDALEHATDLIQRKVLGVPLCRDELPYVTVEEIEVAERDLMDGINYEMRCHHPFNAICVLAAEVEKFMRRDEDPRYFTFENVFEWRHNNGSLLSPRDVFGVKDEEGDLGIEERASLIAQNMMLFSDVLFLFPPGQIAFAAVAMSIDEGHTSAGLPLILRTYLRDRFISKTEDDLLAFEDQILAIVGTLRKSPVMDMQMIGLSRNSVACDRVMVEQADELRRVFCKVNYMLSALKPAKSTFCTFSQKRKFSGSTPMSPETSTYAKVPKVTPTKV